MTGKKGGKPTIPNHRAPQPFGNKTETSSTKDAIDEKPSPKTGTNSINLNGLELTDIPPRPPHSNDHNPLWSLGNFASVLQILGAILVAAFFIWNLSSKIDIVKDDVKEVKTKIEHLDESVTKQTSAIDNMSNSVQRLENENRRTQDLVSQRKK